MKHFLLCLAGGLLFPHFIHADNFGGACTPANAKTDLDINNVRATLLNTGDLWWNLSGSCYEIPKNSGSTSIFCGGLWFGALDDNGQLLTAAMTYRQTGVDFWNGPLDTTYASIADTMCWQYDRFWKVNRADVEAFRDHYNDPSWTIPEAILHWPGNGNATAGQAHFLAPFTDVDGDGIYNARNGDYPAFALNGLPDCNTNLLGDQAIWWVFNDKGGAHTETGGGQFGMEVQAMAFAYHTEDALNDATFYRYKIINRSTANWNQMWMTQFTDSDLGSYDDDYVGCDVPRGMGYTYNGDAIDGTSAQAVPGTYGLHPPAIGIDFVQGPLADANDFIDNDRDSIIDENGERIKMSVFLYYYEDFTIAGNPENADQFYKYMRGHWKDDSPMTYGANAYGGTIPTPFMFPGDSDPYGWGTGGVPQAPWSEASINNTPGDRRFITSVGPFTMAPGEVQTVTIAVPWARDTSSSGDNYTSLAKLQQADDYIQQLFDNCFAIPCSSQAPPSFTSEANGGTVNFTADANGTCTWNFGDNTSSSAKNPSHAYLQDGTYNVCLTVVTACDTQTVCNTINVELPKHECGPMIQRLEGKGAGNQWLAFTAASIDSAVTAPDHRVHFPWYEAMHAPVKVTYENYSALTDGNYRIAFDSTANSAHWKMWLVGGTDTVHSDSAIGAGEKQLIPQWGLGVTVQQVPLPGLGRNPDHNGALGMSITYANTLQDWLSGVSDEDSPTSNNWIRSGDLNNSGIGACDAAFNDMAIGSQFLDPEEDFETYFGGTWSPYRVVSYNPSSNNTICYSAGAGYRDVPTMLMNKIDYLANVDIVFTNDKSKWSRCAVIETGPNLSLTEGFQTSHKIRLHASVDKEGRTVAQGGLSDPNNPEAADYIAADGMGWFPGYAINLETGERLNICFGENSALTAEHGRDMLFNPTSSTMTQFHEPLWGGMHYIYVFNHNGDAHFTTGPLNGELSDVPLYDNGKAIQKILSMATAASDLGQVYRDAIWTTIPLVKPGHSLLETETAVHLRVAKPFASYNTTPSPQNNDNPLYGFSIDKMNLGCNMYDENVNAFPNPFSESCTIMFDNTDNVTFALKLYDMRGRLVRDYENIISDRVVIDGNGLLSGVYFYSLETSGRKPVVGRIVLR